MRLKNILILLLLPISNYGQNIVFDTIQKYDRNHALRIVVTFAKDSLYHVELLNISPNSIFMIPQNESSIISECIFDIGLDDDGYSEVKYWQVWEIKSNDKKIFKFACPGDGIKIILSIIYKEKYIIKMTDGLFVERLRYKKARRLNTYTIR